MWSEIGSIIGDVVSSDEILFMGKYRIKVDTNFNLTPGTRIEVHGRILYKGIVPVLIKDVRAIYHIKRIKPPLDRVRGILESDTDSVEMVRRMRCEFAGCTWNEETGECEC